jgi:hypothetical protein
LLLLNIVTALYVVSFSIVQRELLYNITDLTNLSHHGRQWQDQRPESRISNPHDAFEDLSKKLRNIRLKGANTIAEGLALLEDLNRAQADAFSGVPEGTDLHQAAAAFQLESVNDEISRLRTEAQMQAIQTGNVLRSLIQQAMDGIADQAESISVQLTGDGIVQSKKRLENASKAV